MVNIWQSFSQNTNGSFYGPRCQHVIILSHLCCIRSISIKFSFEYTGFLASQILQVTCTTLSVTLRMRLDHRTKRSDSKRIAIMLSAVTVSECRRASEFKCANNLCLPDSVMCDGYDQCGDGSDEGQICSGLSFLLSICFCQLHRVSKKRPECCLL